jgi:hypothetical protein
MEFFRAPRSRQGERRVTLGLGDLYLVISGLGEDLADRLRRRFRPFTDEATEGSEGLHIELAVEPTDYFIDPPPEPAPNRVLLASDGERVRYLGYRLAGWFDTSGGEGQILLAGGDVEPPERALENYVRAAVAWQAASRGGALVHAASAVRDGRAYLFYGESGAGKSTLAACNRRGRVISDDLTLVLPGPGGDLEIVGSPFRGTYEEGEPLLGRFPLAAGFRIVKDVEASVRAVSRLRALAELVGSLPFVAEAFARRPDLFEQVERSFAACPLAHLHFRKDDSFWDAIEQAGL